MAVDIEILGEREIKRAFKLLPKNVAKKVVRKAMRPAMKIVQQRTKTLVPVDTGLLRKAVKVRAAKRSRNSFGVNVQIGEGDFKGDAYYGAFLEYGTSRIKARESMKHAFEQTGERAKEVAVNQLGDLITQAVKESKQN